MSHSDSHISRQQNPGCSFAIRPYKWRGKFLLGFLFGWLWAMLCLLLVTFRQGGGGGEILKVDQSIKLFVCRGERRI
jgi:hypothetical protein